MCRVCLDSARELVPFDKKLYYTQYSIIDLIHFCTGVVYNDSEEENILPKHLCIPCLEKIQTAYELKTKCVESDKYLSSILGSTVSHQELPEILIDEPFMPSIEVLPYYEESMANTGENDSSDDYSNATYLMKELISGHSKTNKRVLPRNLKSGKSSTCNICQKVFKYSKSYNRHMERHEEESNPEETYKIQVSDHSDDISCKNA